MSSDEPTHLDLFSGIGGFALAAQWAGFRTIGFCELDKYCRKVLAKNFSAERVLANAPIIGDIRNLNGRDFYGVSLITGGFPCQPFSVAGNRKGAADDRAIWPEMFCVISEARPDWVLGENVTGIIPMELDNVLSDLEGIGYATRAFVIPACSVDARHRRDRVWIVGRRIIPDSNGTGSQGRNSEELRECSGERVTGKSDTSLAYTRQSVEWRTAWTGWREPEHDEASEDDGGGGGETPCFWIAEPDVGRVAHGIPYRVDRLKGLGNAIVPQVAYEILREIYAICKT